MLPHGNAAVQEKIESILFSNRPQQSVKMPNWCVNVVKVHSSDKEAMAAFYKKFSDPAKFAFEDFVPVPESIKNSEEVDAWFDWTDASWGTKWDVKDGDQEPAQDNCETYYEVRFETAWAPPIPVLQAIAEQFPALHVTISYHEEGMQFLGYSWWRNGTLCKKVYHEYTSEEDYRELIMLYSELVAVAW
jgi:hypothetical protein